MLDPAAKVNDDAVVKINGLIDNTADILFNEKNNVVGVSLGSNNVLINDNDSIVGIGLGAKIVNGVMTGNPSLTYLVDSKAQIAQLASADVIPPMKHGVLTDVIDIGNLELLSSAFSNQKIIDINSRNSNFNNINNQSYSQNYNYNNNYSYGYNNLVTPQGGTSCNYYNSNNSGTIGCIVRDDLNMYVLSNNHVLNGLNVNPSNNTIIQSNSPIASLSRYSDIIFSTSYSDIQYGNTNRIDAAIANIGRLDNLGNKVKPGIVGLNCINGTCNVKLGSTAQKVGASSGLTNGKVIVLNATLRVNYNNKNAIFTGQTLTTSMANHGDSGSLGLNNNASAFGLLFAGSNKVSVYNPIDEVLNKLGVQIF